MNRRSTSKITGDRRRCNKCQSWSRDVIEKILRERASFVSGKRFETCSGFKKRKRK